MLSLNLATEVGKDKQPSTLPDDRLTVPDLTTMVLSPRPKTSASWTNGHQVPDGYQLLEEVGRGGMGVVFRARQINSNRIVALKMMLGDAGAETQELARFRAEAETTAGLQHPNIVRVIDQGEQDGCPYLALEFLAGGSLHQKLAGGLLPVGQAVQLMATLACALHHVHQHGIVHGDLKPANVLLMADGTPKIADFGLARRLNEERAEAVTGTPSYMAPEQAGGNVGPVGPATDVFGLGAILYELLTGQPPLRETTLSDTLRRVQYEAPVPPSRLRPDLPLELEAICLKCLAKEPQQRYASALALAEDLRSFLAAE